MKQRLEAVHNAMLSGTCVAKNPLSFSDSNPMKLERDSSLSYLQNFLRQRDKMIKGSDKLARSEEKLIGHIRFFRLFVLHKDDSFKKEFIRGDVLKTISDIMMLYDSISFELDQSDEVKQNHKDAASYSFKVSAEKKGTVQVSEKEKAADQTTVDVRKVYVSPTETDELLRRIDQIMIECVWFFTNILISDADDMLFMLDMNVEKNILQIMQHTQNMTVFMHCVWCFRNMSASSFRCHARLLESEILENVVGCVLALKGFDISLVDIQCPESQSGLQSSFDNTIIKSYEQCSDFLLNMINPLKPTTKSLLVTLTPLLKVFLFGCKNALLLKNACTIMSMVLQNAGNKPEFSSSEELKLVATCDMVDYLIQQNLVKVVVPLLLHKNIQVQMASLKLVGDVLFATNQQIETVISYGVLSPLYQLTCSKDDVIRKEACWALSNCATVCNFPFQGLIII